MDSHQLDYGIQPPGPSVFRRVPWGTISLACGLCSGIGVPVFDACTKVPGYAQHRIILAGVALAMMAIVTGIVAVSIGIQTRRGLFGFFIGLLAFFLLPALQRA